MKNKILLLLLAFVFTGCDHYSMSVKDPGDPVKKKKERNNEWPKEKIREYKIEWPEKNFTILN